MEEAKKASLWAQQLSIHCGHLCSQSKEGTQKMHTDVKRAIESKIKEEEFWIKELEERTASIKKVAEELEATERRYSRAFKVCKRFIAVNQECSQQRKEAFHDVDIVTELLHEEARTLRQVLKDIVASTAKASERNTAMKHVCSALEYNIRNKHETLNTDRKLLSLKQSHTYLDSLANAREAPSENSRQHWNTIPNDDRMLQSADDELRLSELQLDETNEMLSKATETISADVVKVTNAIQEHVTHLQQEKSDLESHLDMTNVHLEVTERTMSQLDTAIEEKEMDIQLTKKRLAVYNPRQASEQSVVYILERELSEAENEKKRLRSQFPALEGTVRSLRRARLEISRKISEKVERIETEELRCLGMRIELASVSL